MSTLDGSLNIAQSRSRASFGAAAAVSNWRIVAFILAIFVVAATLSAARKDVTAGFDFDEAAHASYVAHVQQSGRTWPALDDLHMLDIASFKFTQEPNYLVHPSPYYVLLAKLGPALEGHPRAIIIDRLYNVAIAALGLLALMAIGLVARLPRFTFYAYVIPIACIPVLVALAGSINNDNAAFTGGAVATLGLWQLMSTERRAWLWVALAGVVIAAASKFTGLLLVGGMFGGVMIWLAWRGRFQSQWMWPIALAAALALAPYVAFFVQYGSPAPNTLGQIAMLKDNAHAVGWDTAARMSAAVYAFYFIVSFVLGWMPSVMPLNALNYAVLVIPVAAILCAAAGVIVSVRRLRRGDEGPVDVLLLTGAAAFAATFAMHVIYSYQRHLTYGWMMDAYPRYYLPLAALIPLGGLSLLCAIDNPRARAWLGGFLIAGPIVFRLLGAPLG